MKKRLIGLALILSMLCAFMPCVHATEIVDSGTCGADGDNLTWTLDSYGTLTISGTGKMTDYRGGLYEDFAPWYDVFDSERITDVNISEGITSIGSYAFSNCDGVTSINIPNGVKSIGSNAFNGSTYLASITIPNSVTSIENYAFNNCNSLTNVYYNGISAMWDSISIAYGNDCLTNATIHYSNIEGTCGDNVKWALDDDGTLTISGTGDMTDYTYRVIAPWYDYRSYITNVIMYDGITSIGYGAFPNCSNLISVTIPDSVTSIGDYAFSYCDSLASITIGNGLTSIGDYAFYNCNSVETVTGYTHSCAEKLAAYLGAEFISLGSLDYREITVSDSEELLAAIGSYRKIVMNAGTYEISQKISMQFISDLELVGGDGVEIISLDADNPVVNLGYADNITLDGIVMGHYTVDTYGCGLMGYVIYASDCENLTVNNCDLFGCGLNGLSLNKVTEFSADNTIIRDCMYNIMDLYDCDNAELTNCVMKDNAYYEKTRGYYKAIDGENSNVKFTGCEFTDNLNYEFYDASKISVQLDNCNFTRNIWQAAEVVATAVAEVKDDKIAVSVDTENLNPNLNIFTAAYGDNGEYSGYEKMQDGSAELTSESATEVKVFVWDSLSGMKPLCEAKTVDLTEVQ